MSNTSTVIAIDGPAGAGKSTVAKSLAEALGFSYLDTGAMYRALTFKALKKGINLEDEDALVEVALNTNIDLQGDASGLTVLLDGEDVSQDIRTLEVTNNTFYAARAPRIRAIMVEKQRDIGSRKNVVIEGRDIGTVVFPNAAFKFYLDADTAKRTERRARELEAKGKDVDRDQLQQEIIDRDKNDTSRDVGALKQAEDAYYIDSTEHSVTDSVKAMLEIIKKHG